MLVGYLVGLGDRHIQNILIDQNTAELIHIDFGKINKKSYVASILCNNVCRLRMYIATEYGVTATT